MIEYPVLVLVSLSFIAIGIIMTLSEKVLEKRSIHPEVPAGFMLAGVAVSLVRGLLLLDLGIVIIMILFSSLLIRTILCRNKCRKNGGMIESKIILMLLATVSVFIFANIVYAGQVKGKIIEEKDFMIGGKTLYAKVVELETAERDFVGDFSISESSVCLCHGNQGLYAEVVEDTTVFINGEEVLGPLRKKIIMLTRLGQVKAAMVGIYQDRIIDVNGHSFSAGYWKELRISPL